MGKTQGLVLACNEWNAERRPYVQTKGEGRHCALWLDIEPRLRKEMRDQLETA